MNPLPIPSSRSDLIRFSCHPLLSADCEKHWRARSLSSLSTGGQAILSLLSQPVSNNSYPIKPQPSLSILVAVPFRQRRFHRPVYGFIVCIRPELFLSSLSDSEQSVDRRIVSGSDTNSLLLPLCAIPARSVVL
jgi:hypothetical protein